MVDTSASDADTKYFYRFRSIDSAIGERQELKEQVIYFSSLDELNDPMEGSYDLFWSGDKVVWRGLLRHYVLCLSHAILYAALAGPSLVVSDDERKIVSTMIRCSPSVPISKEFENAFEEIWTSFSKSVGIEHVLELLNSLTAEVRREELTVLLRTIHSYALQSIMLAFQIRGLLQGPDLLAALNSFQKVPVLQTLLELQSLANENPLESREAVFSSISHVLRQLNLHSVINGYEGKSALWRDLCFDYADYYVSGLRHLLFAEWYAACFVISPNQASMWGNYADGHKGICLKFEGQIAQHDKSCGLELKQILGWSADHSGTKKNYGKVHHPFRAMSYTTKFPVVDFFRSLGRISVQSLRNDWYTNECGEQSSCYKDVFENEQEWQSQHWKNFDTLINKKFQDWAHENEYRLILYSLLDSYQEKEDRALTYDFGQLKSVIFGINTKPDDKAKIIQIINEKCNKEANPNFQFGQAVYSSQTGKIEVMPLNLFGATVT